MVEQAMNTRRSLLGYFAALFSPIPAVAGLKALEGQWVTYVDQGYDERIRSAFYLDKLNIDQPISVLRETARPKWPKPPAAVDEIVAVGGSEKEFFVMRQALEDGRTERWVAFHDDKTGKWIDCHGEGASWFEVAK